MLRTVAYRTKNTVATAMPLTSLLTKLQDASTTVLFGNDGGTDKTSFYDLVDKDMQGTKSRWRHSRVMFSV
ncbi:glutathione peroxidase [Skeletonema marinoi]|uniref:Glutathione peroxidase n=1 Tax=Skeletonema marinoi TaxID=267567 RepID=A0AAD9DB33_9STRA|nr:glutathione peroxidase [Skeletonema marinoi]